MRFAVLFFRACVIVLVFFEALWTYLVLRARGRGEYSADERNLLRGEVVAGALERLGATFVKLGQILATRPDLLPEGVTTGLSKLQDDVPAAPFSAVARVLDEELGEGWRDALTIDEKPLAAASVAQVHRGRLADGREVAVKIQRPEAASQIDRDLSLLSAAARLFDRIPGMRYMAIPGAIEAFGNALRAQLDFELEAKNNRRIAANFAGDPKIRVPDLHPTLCSKRVLTMQLIHGIKPTDVREDRPGLAAAGFRCIAKMVFLDGFVHADMHPGNLMFTAEGHVYLIDMGLVAEIPLDMRKPWTDSFVAIVMGDGRRAASLFYGYSPHVSPHTDYAAFERDVTAHLNALRGRPLNEIEVTTAVGGAMAILRKHKVQVDPVFTVVNLAMLVAEGIGKQLDPRFDMYEAVGPFLAEAALRYPTGRAPIRAVPG